MYKYITNLYIIDAYDVFQSKPFIFGNRKASTDCRRKLYSLSLVLTTTTLVSLDEPFDIVWPLELFPFMKSLSSSSRTLGIFSRMALNADIAEAIKTVISRFDFEFDAK